MASVGSPTLCIQIPDILEDDENNDENIGTVPYTSSPLDTYRGGKGFQVSRKSKDMTGDGIAKGIANGIAKKHKRASSDTKDAKDTKESKREKTHARY